MAGLKLLVVSTPMGPLGQGLGGGVELTLEAVLESLHRRGHALSLVAAAGSQLPSTPLQQSWLEPGVPQPAGSTSRARRRCRFQPMGCCPAFGSAP